jgi:hypothetical protein
LDVPSAKASVRLFALFPIRKTTAKKSLFSKTGDTAAILDAKKAANVISFAIAKPQLNKINLKS